MAIDYSCFFLKCSIMYNSNVYKQGVKSLSALVAFPAKEAVANKSIISPHHMTLGNKIIMIKGFVKLNIGVLIIT